MPSFSKRNNYRSEEQPIMIYESAPNELREFIISAATATGHDAKRVRSAICYVLRKIADSNNWSTQPVLTEAVDLIGSCKWFKVYDIIEQLYSTSDDPTAFADEVNDFFRENGIGYKLEDGQVLFRGTDNFEQTIHEAGDVLGDAGLNTAKSEINEAIKDLSRKPEADITGAVQHALACLECTAREAIGGSKDTLGALIKKNRGIIPPPLDVVVDKIWGFSSEQGRHLSEGGEPSFEEAELLVGLSASISTYLARKL
ncbi:AbiJ-NTD4 domain-containing protein [Hymenobacter rubripertinctus]|uniref:HEPN AbiJ-N-terminal domain-containing protein n=1 Tax=Hymenobacter rubripertinctus TaxID=2029981 RepID=A0A418QKZ4_9BACT|nr:hypothetical protein [Hymenobacter rubripertinctus]RIY05802.1 hypothetical protein D0T11_19720 [Hymenobacter rubripertinctus]